MKTGNSIKEPQETQSLESKMSRAACHNSLTKPISVKVKFEKTSAPRDETSDWGQFHSGQSYASKGTVHQLTFPPYPAPKILSHLLTCTSNPVKPGT